MSSDEEAKSATAHLTIWRVFGLLDKFEDCPAPYWQTGATVASHPNEKVTVTIGELPENLITTLKQWRAQISGSLHDAFISPITAEERERMYHEQLGNVQLGEFEDPYVAWLTISVTREVYVEIPVEGELELGDKLGKILDELKDFEERGNDFLDCAAASTIGAAEGLNVRHLRFADRRPYLTAPSKAAFTRVKTVMKIKDSGLSVGRNDGWAAAPTAKISSAVSAIARTPITKDFSKLIGRPMSWLSSAMGEQEDDLRRFTLAFAGLELLSTQSEKRSREKLISKCEHLDGDLPINELLWPSLNDDFVWRNLVFRFAVMASVYSPETVKADIAIFRTIAKARNDTFHGSDQTINRELSIACEGLLRKYLSLVAVKFAES